MPSSMLKATTALTISISLLQPAPLAAQGFAIFAHRGEPWAAKSGPVRQERLWQVQTCADDPTLPECATDATVAPDDGAAAAPQTAPEAKAQPEPVLVPEPAAVPEAAPEQTPETADAPETAPEPAAEPVAEPVVEAAPPATTAEEPAAPADDAPVVQIEVPPPAEPDQAASPSVEPATGAIPQPQPDAITEPVAESEPGPVVAPPDAPDAPAPETGTLPSKDATADQGEGAETAAPADDGAGADAPLPTQPVAPDAQATPEPGSDTAPVDAPADGVAPEPIATPATEVIPEPTAEDQAIVEELMTDPEVAAAVDTLAETLATPDDTAASTDPVSSGLQAVLAAEGAGGDLVDPATTTTQTLGAAESRTSAQDFTSRLVTTAQPAASKDDDKLSDLEKAGLFALGAVVVGMVIANNRVVANSGDRVVVDRGDGNLAIWKDDNANLRAPGVVETTDRFKDGSTLTTLNRPDGSQIVTIRDATGRVLRRDRVNPDGARVALIDDTRPYLPVEVSALPRAKVPELRLADTTDIALLRALLSEAEQPGIGRTFSLAQVRDIQELRSLAPELSGDPITFATGSSAIQPQEAGKLARIGQLMTDMIADNPRELFLIEGHTDAVGSAAYNLALSDRRAESVALALTEIFGVPAENMVIQGYGERFPKVANAGDEPRNRRVALRRITWLIDG